VWLTHLPGLPRSYHLAFLPFSAPAQPPSLAVW
jgi:hypothetical protein